MIKNLKVNKQVEGKVNSNMKFGELLNALNVYNLVDGLRILNDKFGITYIKIAQVSGYSYSTIRKFIHEGVENNTSLSNKSLNIIIKNLKDYYVIDKEVDSKWCSKIA